MSIELIVVIDQIFEKAYAWQPLVWKHKKSGAIGVKPGALKTKKKEYFFQESLTEYQKYDTFLILRSKKLKNGAGASLKGSRPDFCRSKG